MNKTEKIIEYLHCIFCEQDTKHELVFRYNFSQPIYCDGTYLTETPQQWDLFQCLGCDGVVLRVEKTFPPEHEPQIFFFPEKSDRDGLTRKRYRTLPPRLEHLYNEVIDSFNNQLYLLCAAGIRSLIEGICSDKNITKGKNRHGKIVRTLEGKINGLTSIIPKNIAANLHSMRFLGNQALHELEVPQEDDIHLAISVIEDILNIVYDLDYKSTMLKERIFSNDTDNS